MKENLNALMCIHLSTKHLEHLEKIEDVRFKLYYWRPILDTDKKTDFWLRFLEFCNYIHRRNIDYNLWIKLPFKWTDEEYLETRLHLEIRIAWKILDKLK